jgi:hypothetical protein
LFMNIYVEHNYGIIRFLKHGGEGWQSGCCVSFCLRIIFWERLMEHEVMRPKH